MQVVGASSMVDAKKISWKALICAKRGRLY